MLAAGFKKVNNADIPNGITPYQFTSKEITDVANGVITGTRSLSLSEQNISQIQANKLSVKGVDKSSNVFGPEEPEEGGIKAKAFQGGTQFYYFVNMNAMVSVGFTFIKGTGWKYTSHRVSVSKVETSGSDSGYYEEISDGGTYDGDIACKFTSSGRVYYKGYGETYNANIIINGSSGVGGNPYLIVTVDR